MHIVEHVHKIEKENKLLRDTLNDLVHCYKGNWFSRYHTEMSLNDVITEEVARIILNVQT